MQTNIDNSTCIVLSILLVDFISGPFTMHCSWNNKEEHRTKIKCFNVVSKEVK